MSYERTNWYVGTDNTQDLRNLVNDTGNDGFLKLVDHDYATICQVAKINYDTDITNRPALFNGVYGSLSGLPDLFDKQYTSLQGLPTLFDKQYTSLQGLPILIDKQYTSLQGLPILFDKQYTSLQGLPMLYDVLPVSKGGTGATSSTGSGAVVLSTSPSFLSGITSFNGITFSDSLNNIASISSPVIL